MTTNKYIDEQFALQLRRLLLSIATLICRRYNNDVLLIVLKGEQKQDKLIDTPNHL